MKFMSMMSDLKCIQWKNNNNNNNVFLKYLGSNRQFQSVSECLGVYFITYFSFSYEHMYSVWPTAWQKATISVKPLCLWSPTAKPNGWSSQSTSSCALITITSRQGLFRRLGLRSLSSLAFFLFSAFQRELKAPGDSSLTAPFLIQLNSSPGLFHLFPLSCNWSWLSV